MIHVIAIIERMFDPSDLTVYIGDSVCWSNLSYDVHNVVSSTPLVGGDTYESGDIVPSDVSDFLAMLTPQVIAYRCKIHPTMVGTVRAVARPG